MSDPSLTVCLEDVRSAYNVGSVFRTCDAAGVSCLYLTGRSAHPPHPKLQKTALDSQASVTWQYHTTPTPLYVRLKNNSVRLIALESIPTAPSIYSLDFTSPTCLIFGNEVSGLSPDSIRQADLVATIPMKGIKHSLNLASSVAVAVYEFTRKLSASHQSGQSA